MLKKMNAVLYLTGLIFALELFCFSVHAGALKDHPPADKKYKVSVCSLFKNEARYLKEWLEYHRLVGVDHFYLYNNASIDRSVEVLTPYVREGLVTLVYWPNFIPEHLMESAAMWALSTQLPAYQHAAKFFGEKETEWLVVLDVDEFIVPVRNQSISEVLDMDDESPGFQVVSEFYNAAREEGALRKKLLIETVQLTGEPPHKIENAVEKLIFKPQLHTSFIWPPYQCNFKDNKTPSRKPKGELRINKYVNRPKGFLYFGKIKDKLHVDNRMLTEDEAFMLLKEGFEIEDRERPIYRFIPELLKRMGLETGWGW